MYFLYLSLLHLNMEISYTNDTLQTEERIKKVKRLIEDGASQVEHTFEGKPIY